MFSQWSLQPPAQRELTEHSVRSPSTNSFTSLFLVNSTFAYLTVYDRSSLQTPFSFMTIDSNKNLSLNDRPMGPTSVQRLCTFIAIFRCNFRDSRYASAPFYFPGPTIQFKPEIFAKTPSRSRLGLHLNGFYHCLPSVAYATYRLLPMQISNTLTWVSGLKVGYSGIGQESPISWSDLASMDSYLPKRRTDTCNMNFPRQYSVKSSHH